MRKENIKSDESSQSSVIYYSESLSAEIETNEVLNKIIF